MFVNKKLRLNDKNQLPEVLEMGLKRGQFMDKMVTDF